MTTPEPELRALFQARASAMGARDIERVMALYAPDVIYFDLVPPLRYSGSDALRRRFLDLGSARIKTHATGGRWTSRLWRRT